MYVITYYVIDGRNLNAVCWQREIVCRMEIIYLSCIYSVHYIIHVYNLNGSLNKVGYFKRLPILR